MTTFRLNVIRDPTDQLASDGVVTWAIGRLVDAAAARGGSVRVAVEADADDEHSGRLTVAGVASRAAETLAAAGLELPEGPETLLLAPDQTGRMGTLACGSDPRGLSYAILELADRIEYADDPVAALRVDDTVIERPANAVRSVTRLFCSEVEDKPWFYAQTFWREYLSMLTAQRFNRFSLTLGLGYNYPRDVTDAYLYFAYPFLLSIPGYGVRVRELDDEERDHNLEILRFISEEAVARGLDFQLGLWTHAYAWIDSPNAHHTIEGLTPKTHAPYCRDAVSALLDACPRIGGVTFRIHGEGGVPEGSWDFWRTVFDGVSGCGRRVGLDLHAKGLDERTLGHALETGLPVTVSPKFWAEHMGLPYHQAAIREGERLPREDPSARSEWHRYMRVSEGSRPFTRYGYADFLREDRAYELVFRLWPGTQRLLMWGDPAFAAGYGRAASLAGSQGLEWCEPLTFKGREGSGVAGSRTGYADESLVPRADWEKYAYAYRLFGRLTYDPDASPEVWRRPLRAHFGDVTLDAESALASASRILPLVTVAHHPSASNNYYWPEMYTDMPIVWSEHGTRPHPYVDTPEPRRFGTVSPLDPEVFSSVVDHVAELRTGVGRGRLSPLDVAILIDGLAQEATNRLRAVEEKLSDPDAEARRWSIDVAILAAVGRFFAGKLRAGVGYELYAQIGQVASLGWALEAYRAARRAWLEAAALADEAYVRDITFGPQGRIRGHWRDRLPAIDDDLRAMEARLRLITAVLDGEPWPPILAPEGMSLEADVVHVPPASFRVGEDLELALGRSEQAAVAVDRVVLRYRPMNQSLAFSTFEMERRDRRFVARIPAAELDGRYPISYAFVLWDRDGAAGRHPGLGKELAERPYFVVRPDNGPDPREDPASERPPGSLEPRT
jgi:hypothetical protein